MTEIVLVEMPEGDVIRVEVESRDDGDVAWRRDPRALWTDVQGQVSRISEVVAHAVKNGLPDAPTTVSIEFGLKLTIAAGALVGVLAKSGAEGSLIIKLGWENKGATGEATK